jgi:hypothetical protein
MKITGLRRGLNNRHEEKGWIDMGNMGNMGKENNMMNNKSNVRRIYVRKRHRMQSGLRN